MPAALGDTLYFGGTFWNADSLRWEALVDSVWTFDTGVGSSFDHDHPDVDPAKDPSRHAFMEGWVGFDYTAPDYSQYAYFRRLSSGDFGLDVCVGAAAGLGGAYSMWAGVTQAEADSLGYAAGQGYGHRWNTILEHAFTYAGTDSITVQFDYTHELEDTYDFAYVFAEYADQSLEQLAEFTGTGQGSLNVTFMPPQVGAFTLYVQVESDGIWSDEDGLFPTTCGAFAFDDVSISGGGISYATDFETGPDGWTVRQAAGPGGEYSDIVALADIDTAGVACSALQDTVLIFSDDLGGHPLKQRNYVVSPWIDLKSVGAEFYPDRFVEMDVLFNQSDPLELGLLFQMQHYPYTNSEGDVVESPWYETAHLQFPSSLPSCERRIYDLAGFAPNAERVRIMVGMASYICSGCERIPTSGPWIDNVRFGVARSMLSKVSIIDVPADAFPSDGGTDITSTARMDGRGGGDSLAVINVVQNIPGQEVEVVFAVRPGPGIDDAAFTAWLGNHAFVEHSQGLDWYSARMDTAEVDGALWLPEWRWMTCYHEEDPNFSNTDTSPDPYDPGHLQNDIFPDDLFTPGTRIDLYYRSRSTLTGNSWVVFVDPVEGLLNWEALPSSMTPQGTNNAILFVNSLDDPLPGNVIAAGAVQGALATLLPGGSSNAENTPWDRLDYWIQTPDRTQRSIATPQQLDAYDTIIWHAEADISLYDGSLLESWLTSPGGVRNLFLAGGPKLLREMYSDGEVRSLAEGPLGAVPPCGNIADYECPPGTTTDPSPCFELVPKDPPLVAGIPVRAEPQWTYHVVAEHQPLVPVDPPTWGSPSGDERYQGNVSKPYASIVNVASGDPAFRTVLDGVRLDSRYQGAECSVEGQVEGATQRLQEVLSFFGKQVVSVPRGEGGTAAYWLSEPRPNPLLTATEIHFQIPRSERVTIGVYDIQGRLVQFLVDEKMDKGAHVVEWDGRNQTGKRAPAGVYFYKLDAGSFSRARKVIVLR